MREVLPLIRKRRPETTLAIVGRTPAAEDPATRQSKIRASRSPAPCRISARISGTPRSRSCPLRIGGGTRLKIYEAMAAKIPVVSTTIGAEGLTVNPPDDIRIADTPEAFAAQCLDYWPTKHPRPCGRRRLADGQRQLLLGPSRPLLRKSNGNRALCAVAQAFPACCVGGMLRYSLLPTPVNGTCLSSAELW